MINVIMTLMPRSTTFKTEPFVVMTVLVTTMMMVIVTMVTMTSDKTEPYPELQSAVATLSTGPVGPGDAINLTDRDTLMRLGSLPCTARALLCRIVLIIIIKVFLKRKIFLSVRTILSSYKHTDIHTLAPAHTSILIRYKIYFTHNLKREAET